MAISENQVVAIEYELTQSGQSEVIDSNKGQAPLEFMMGRGQVIPGLEKELANLSSGDKKVIMVSAEDAYGPRREDAVETVPAEQFAGIELEVGMQLYGQSEEGQTIMVTVISFDKESVTVDYNHPLAGKDLTFSVDIKDVRDATEAEIESGIVGGDDHNCGCGTGDGGCH